MSLKLTLTPAYPVSLALQSQGVKATVNTQPSVQLALAAVLGSTGGISNSGILHNQMTPAMTWTINHNLGFVPSVEVYSVGGAEIDADVLHISANQTQINFVTPTAGSARLN